ncbi:MAG: hypothetical protein RMJ84_04065 [Sandaracinaceae bacterium]|nr:hypothetical protein [Sandaracinaceae bacterium]
MRAKGLRIALVVALGIVSLFFLEKARFEEPTLEIEPGPYSFDPFEAEPPDAGLSNHNEGSEVSGFSTSGEVSAQRSAKE